MIRKLQKVQEFLPSGYFLKVMDAYRPLVIQEHYYQKLYLKLKRQYPNWSERKIKRLQNVLVYPPKLGTPPHSTGAALDVTLTKNLKTGKSIKMNYRKVPKYKQNEIFSKKIPQEMKNNRLILYQAMRKVGFSNYSKEWWHWSYGDRGWAMRENRKYAIYGTVPDKLLPKILKNK